MSLVRNRFAPLAAAITILALCGVHPRPASGQTVQPAGPKPAAGPAASAPKTLEFDTPEISGTIRLDGAYHGVTRLVDKRSGRQVIDSRYSALNLFKLMSVNLVMGQPREMERTVEFGTDWAQIAWPATEMHLGDITARYEVHAPNAVDLIVTLRSQGAYPAYELFLSNYFDKIFQPHVYLKARDPKITDLVLPTVSDVFRGTVLVFPRDSHAARHCVDGRWDRSEGSVPTVQMCPVRHYARCLAIEVDPEKTMAVVLMARPRDCYAFSTRYHAAKESDRLTTYSAFDFSLFGGDVAPGEEQTVRVRLAVTPLDSEFSQPLKLYESFLAETDQSHGKD
ncbi:MAG: hypothetical protein HUU20_28325 [Pirellulales bacterium]|nr:hypothetical protein [Pirellulales bacterium]